MLILLKYGIRMHKDQEPFVLIREPLLTEMLDETSAFMKNNQQDSF